MNPHTSQRPAYLVTSHSNNSRNLENLWNHSVLVNKLRQDGIAFKEIYSVRHPGSTDLKLCVLIDEEQADLALDLGLQYGQDYVGYIDFRRNVWDVDVKQPVVKTIQGELKNVPESEIGEVESFLYDPLKQQYFVTR